MITKNIEQRGNYIQKIITDNIIFCKPRFDYKEFYEKKEKIIFIEREPNNKSANNYIPCMFHMNLNTNNFLICFHGNSEDIFTTEKFGLDFRDYIKMNSKNILKNQLLNQMKKILKKQIFNQIIMI